jgi:hypothetical protein
VPDESLGWRLVRFPELVDRWIEREAPGDDARLVVLDWILTQSENPYRGMRRESGFDNLWFGPIRGTEDGWNVVTCSHWIYERGRIVQCEDICTLSQPL